MDSPNSIPLGFPAKSQQQDTSLSNELCSTFSDFWISIPEAGRPFPLVLSLFLGVVSAPLFLLFLYSIEFSLCIQSLISPIPYIKGLLFKLCEVTISLNPDILILLDVYILHSTCHFWYLCSKPPCFDRVRFTYFSNTKCLSVLADFSKVQTQDIEKNPEGRMCVMLSLSLPIINLFRLQKLSL